MLNEIRNGTAVTAAFTANTYLDYANPLAGTVSAFSSPGPTLDLKLKPNLGKCLYPLLCQHDRLTAFESCWDALVGHALWISLRERYECNALP